MRVAEQRRTEESLDYESLGEALRSALSLCTAKSHLDLQTLSDAELALVYTNAESEVRAAAADGIYSLKERQVLSKRLEDGRVLYTEELARRLDRLIADVPPERLKDLLEMQAACVEAHREIPHQAIWFGYRPRERASREMIRRTSARELYLVFVENAAAAAGYSCPVRGRATLAAALVQFMAMNPTAYL